MSTINQKKIYFNLFWVLFGLCMMNLLIMHYYISTTSRLEWNIGFLSFIDNFVAVIFDVAILFVVFYILTIRNQIATLLSCFIVTWLWSWANVIYSRFFYHYVTFSAMSQADSLFDEGIQSCLVNNIQWIDLYYPICLVSFVCSLVKYKAKVKNPLANIGAIFLVFIVVNLCCYALFRNINPERKKACSFTSGLYSRHFSLSLYSHSPSYTSYLRGSIIALIDEIALVQEGTKELSVTEKETINSAINESNSTIGPRGHGEGVDNIIFILVESYMSFTSDMLVDGREVTPNLNALKHDSIVYYNGQMRDNTTLGASSDGQFIYMTGLLPLRSVVTISKAKKDVLPGLPKKLGKESRMIIPTIVSLWDQEIMCKRYGFDYLYSSYDYPGEHNNNLNDEQVFDLAMQKDKECTSPFFSIILTLNMHKPYINEVDETFQIHDTSISDELRCYLNACHYTDRQIGLYLEHLKASGLYDRSLIIITADHPVYVPSFGIANKNIPIYIINAPELTNGTWHTGACNQLDVYTTLLDILGIKSDWYGLGFSLFEPEYNSTVTDQKWDISEWILLSDFFNSESSKHVQY